MSTTSDITPFDPFELKDHVAGSIVDPYPRMAELRAESPVHVGPVDLGEGLPELPGEQIPPVTVFGYEEAAQVLRDGETYSSSVYSGVMGAVMGRTILEMDDPEHRAMRALVSPAFRSKFLAQWEVELVQTVVNELIDSFIADGETDLVRTITFNFPVQVIARILGLSRADYPMFQRCAMELVSVVANWDRGVAASEQLREYFAGVLEERRAHPATDLISELATVEVDGERLTDEEIFSFLRLLLPAGVETTYRASGTMLYGLLTNPDQLKAVVADRDLIGQAFEETLRWEPPVTLILRQATKDTELAGVAIDKGADVALLLGAANRDPRRYERPEEFDIFRETKGHLGFGFGPHVCVGMHLARMETRVAINALFDRLPDMKLSPKEGADFHIQGLAFRSPLGLPITFAA